MVPLIVAHFDGLASRAPAKTELELLERIEAALWAHLQLHANKRDREREFIEHIAAAPEDDGPRLVYSDYLQERGGPGDQARGQFIALDIALARGEKVKGKRNKLFKSSQAALLGPIAALVAPPPTSAGC